MNIEKLVGQVKNGTKVILHAKRKVIWCWPFLSSSSGSRS